ncbi:MAG: cupin domain-containing protein [Planctomycetota bacterium]|nr:MAG: cupin domain-containing protein [Planctomycetota bacterium]
MSEFFPLPNELAKHNIFPGVSITTCAASQMMMSLVKMEPNSEVKSHSHPHEQIGIVLKGRAVFKIGDEKKALAVGDFYRIPSNVVHQVWSFEEGAEALDIFSPIREDYL